MNTLISLRRCMMTAAAALLAGCVQVSAPEKPIEINLNINIRQEVVVRLQQRDDRAADRHRGAVEGVHVRRPAPALGPVAHGQAARLVRKYPCASTS